ncbi:MAG: ABC transporter permease [Planctomycetes bacterium]|nr:ABC transporter permease [Planctomycetota bacterium]
MYSAAGTIRTPGFPISVLHIASHTFSRFVRSWWNLVIALVVFVPALLRLWFALRETGENVEKVHRIMLHAMYLHPVPIVLSLLVAGFFSVSSEIGDRTIVFLFLRPVKKGAIYLGKLLALVLYLIILVSISYGTYLFACVITGGIPNGAEEISPLSANLCYWGILCLGVSAYGALFNFVAIWMRKTMIGLIVNLIYAIILQLLFVQLFRFGRAKLAAISFHMQCLTHYLTMPWKREDEASIYKFRTVEESLLYLAGFFLVSLILGYLLFTRREHSVKE